MNPFDPRRRELLAGLAGALVAGCAGTPMGGTAGPPVPAPQWRRGDRWTYNISDGFRVPVVWDEVHEVVAAGPSGYTVQVTGKGPTTDFARTELWSTPGILLSGPVMDRETRPFSPPMEYFRFPLTGGDSWNQMFDIAPGKQGFNGRLSRSVRVGGFEQVATPAGTFNAVGMRIIMNVDDEEFWRTATQANYQLWYAPEVGAMVRQIKQASYFEKRGRDMTSEIRSQNATLLLTSFSRGAG
jgi:hypothetical protein